MGDIAPKGGKQYEEYCLGCVNTNRIDAAVSKVGDSCLLNLDADITPLFTEVMADIRSEVDLEDGDIIL